MLNELEREDPRRLRRSEGTSTTTRGYRLADSRSEEAF